MKRYWTTLLLMTASAAACGDGPVTDGVQGNGGDLGERSGCLETPTRLTNLADSGLSEKDVQTILDTFLAPHEADLTWHDGSRTQVTGTFANLKAFQIESRRDPNAQAELDRECVDRLTLELDVGLTTADGRLAESLQGVMFERDGADGPWTAFPHVNAADLMGSYESQLADAGPLTAVYFELSLSDEVFAGSVSEETRQGDERSMSASLAHWQSNEP